MPLIGYARVSTEDQTPLPQAHALRAAGCTEVHEECASDGNRARPVLASLLEQIRTGDTLVVVRIDRLARSLSHLLEVIERLEAKGAFFRSIQDPIDTASPQGKFTLQVLGAAAEFERALIRERTKAGLASARREGRVGGNPGLRARDPAAQRKVRLARQGGYMERLGETAQEWVPQVRRLRPDMAWEDVLRIVNAPLPEARRWTQGRLLRAVRAYVRDGFLPAAVLGRAGRRDTDDRLPAIVAAIKARTPTSRCKRSATGRRRCANVPRAGVRLGSLPPSGCSWSEPRSWGCWPQRNPPETCDRRPGSPTWIRAGCTPRTHRRFHAPWPAAHLTGSTGACRIGHPTSGNEWLFPRGFGIRSSRCSAPETTLRLVAAVKSSLALHAVA